MAARLTYGPARGNRRSRKTRCLIDETQEALDEEARLRESALVFTVAGEPASVCPANVEEGIRSEFPDVPAGGLQVSLMRPGSFFVRFDHRRWFDMVKDCGTVPFRGTPLLVRRWNRLAFATSVQSRSSVRLFIQGIPPQEFSVQTAQDLLPECSIYQVVIESFDKVDLSYFVARAWVDDPDEVPTETVLTVRPRARCSDPLTHVSLPPGFGLEGGDSEVCACTEHLPRKLHYPVLVHVDSVTFYPPRPEYATRRDGLGEDDEDGAPPPEEMPHPWAGGVPDDVTRARTGFGLSLAERHGRRHNGCSYSGRYHRVQGVLQPKERFANAM